MKRQLLTILLFSLISLNIYGQDPVFSQFYSAPLQLNPAFTGNTLEPRIAINYRQQWPGLSSPFVTYAASYEQFFEKVNSGLGVLVQVDDSGDGIFETSEVKITYSYRLTIKDGFFAKFGAEVGARQVNLDWDRLVFADQIDMIEGPSPGGIPIMSDEIRPESLSNTDLDIGAGFLFYNQHFYAGISGKHLNTPDESFIQFNENLEAGLPIRWSVHGGTQIKIREGNRLQAPIYVSPNATYFSQADFAQLNVGAILGIGSVFTGAWYRHANTNPDAVIFLVGFQKDIYKIGYSFDLTVSELAASGTGGTHELSLILNFENSAQAKNKRRNNKYNDCFEIFR